MLFYCGRGPRQFVKLTAVLRQEELKASLSKRIFRFDKRIRQFGVVNSVGALVLSASRPDFVPLEPLEETNKLFVQIVLMKGILGGINKYHGKIRGAIVMREKVTMIMYDGIDRIFVFSTEPDFPLEKVEKLGNLLDTIPIE
jgi:hypothetical protein